MKKILIYALYMIGAGYVLPNSSIAQSKVELGIMGGFEQSSFKNFSFATDNSPGIEIGLYAVFPINSSFTLRPELAYASRGARARDSFSNTRYELSVDYVQIPVLIQYSTRLFSNGSPYIIAGPYAAWLAESYSDVYLLDLMLPTPSDLVDQANNFDLGFVAGLGTALNIFGAPLKFEARFQKGWLSVYGTGSSNSPKNEAFSLLIGIPLYRR